MDGIRRLMATDGIYPDLVDGGRVRCLDRQVLSKERGWREAKKNEVEQKRQKACPRSWKWRERQAKRRFSGVKEEGGQVWAAEGCKAR